MKKYWYFFLCVVLSAISYTPENKNDGRMSKKDFKDHLKKRKEGDFLLTPFTPLSLLCSCSKDDAANHPDTIHSGGAVYVAQVNMDGSHYSYVHSSHYSASTHTSHDSHSSHTSSIHSSHGSHTSSVHSSHSSHSSHRSHTSHRSSK